VSEIPVSGVLAALLFILSSSNFNILGVFELPAVMKTLISFERQDLGVKFQAHGKLAATSPDLSTFQERMMTSSSG
jgi:hypothetical protein